MKKTLMILLFVLISGTVFSKYDHHFIFYSGPNIKADLSFDSKALNENLIAAGVDFPFEFYYYSTKTGLHFGHNFYYSRTTRSAQWYHEFETASTGLSVGWKYWRVNYSLIKEFGFVKDQWTGDRAGFYAEGQQIKLSMLFLQTSRRKAAFSFGCEAYTALSFMKLRDSTPLLEDVRYLSSSNYMILSVGFNFKFGLGFSK